MEDVAWRGHPRPTGEGRSRLPGASGPPSWRLVHAVPGGSSCSTEPPVEPALARSAPGLDTVQHDQALSGPASQKTPPVLARTSSLRFRQKSRGVRNRRASGPRVRRPPAGTHRLPPARAPQAPAIRVSGRSDEYRTAAKGGEKRGEFFWGFRERLNWRPALSGQSCRSCPVLLLQGAEHEPSSAAAAGCHGECCSKARGLGSCVQIPTGITPGALSAVPACLPSGPLPRRPGFRGAGGSSRCRPHADPRSA